MYLFIIVVNTIVIECFEPFYTTHNACVSTYLLMFTNVFKVKCVKLFCNFFTPLCCFLQVFLLSVNVCKNKSD